MQCVENLKRYSIWHTNETTNTLESFIIVTKIDDRIVRTIALSTIGLKNVFDRNLIEHVTGSKPFNMDDVDNMIYESDKFENLKYQIPHIFI